MEKNLSKKQALQEKARKEMDKKIKIKESGKMIKK